MKSRLKLAAAALLVLAVSCGAALTSFLRLVHDADEDAQAAGEAEQDVTYVGGRPAKGICPNRSPQGTSPSRARDRLERRLFEASASPFEK